VLRPGRLVPSDGGRPATGALGSEQPAAVEEDAISLRDWNEGDTCSLSGTSGFAPTETEHVTAGALSLVPENLHALDPLKLVSSVNGPLSIVLSAASLDALSGTCWSTCSIDCLDSCLWSGQACALSVGWCRPEYKYLQSHMPCNWGGEWPL
jgi:hypothetical protein